MMNPKDSYETACSIAQDILNTTERLNFLLGTAAHNGMTVHIDTDATTDRTKIHAVVTLSADKTNRKP